MKLVKNAEKYYIEIYRLRTAPENLKGFVNKSLFTLENHLKYMREYGSNYYILLNRNNLPVGFIGDVSEDIRLAVTPSNHGKGYGLFMLKKFIEISDKKKLKAKVLIDNRPSMRIFEKAGFRLYSSDERFNYYEFIKE